MLRLDHVLLAVPDLAAAAAAIHRDHGLTARDGGRHPGAGTANLIVPLGGPYLELIAVADPGEASGSPLGRAVAAAATGGPRLMAWCVAPGDLAAAARSRGLAPAPGERVRPDGSVVRWRLAGLDRALADPALPFLIGWDDPAAHPGRGPAGPAAGVRGITVGARDPAAVGAWCAGLDVALEVVPGDPGPRRVIVEAAGGDLVIEGGPPST